ncbi:MAG TPA: SIR2 family protein, partial [Saprospiraceae bacterium]|nr:SIR2 family protein [Saprospiraceae bacterium]
MSNIPSPILEALKDDRLILWVGAGFSQRRLGLPSWRGLVEELADACLPAQESAALKAQLDAKTLTEVQALESLQPYDESCRHILQKRFEFNLDYWDERLEDFHLLWQISHKIITTNYDTGLDLTRPGSVPKIIHNQRYQRQRLVDGQKFYFKLHGCASEPENCILFEQQYQDLYRDTSADRLDNASDEDTPAKFLLKYLLTGHTVLFVGFGIEERIDFVLEYIHRLLGGAEQPKYTLTQRDNATTWPHTEKWAIADWSDMPELLCSLADKKAEYNPPIVRGDIPISYDRPYVGRDAEVEAMEKFFRGSTHFFFLSGAGGMGKSHLLDAVVQRLPPAEQPLYFRIERHYTLLTLTQKLGIAPLPPAPKGQANQHLLKALERVGRPLVFDDFYEISDPELFYSLLELPKWRDIKSLIISRSLPPDWAKFDSNVPHRELRELDRPAFDECLHGLAAQMPAYEGASLSTQQLDTCWQLCGGYPLGGHLLLGLLAEPDFEPAQIDRLDLATDPSRSHFVGRLLDAILIKGSPAERNLAREVAVFAEPVPEPALAALPAWQPDRVAFYALWHRKGLIFRRKVDALYGMHALVRALLLQQLGDSREARACAGRYYESLTGLPEVERVVALQKALEHYDLSPDDERTAFRARMEEAFVAVPVTQLRASSDPALAIERFSFRQRLNPGDASAANELGMAYRRQRNFVKAIEVLQKAAALQPSDIILLNELGITLREAGQRDKAIEVLQKAADAGNIQSFNELGITLREAGERDKA